MNVTANKGAMLCHGCGKPMGKTKGTYNYEEAGLDIEVRLADINIYRCECTEVLPEIPDIEALHRAIAYSLCKRPNPLSGAMFRFLRKELGLKAKELAALMGVSIVTVSRWETGAEPIGTQSDKLIRMIVIQTLEETCNKVFKGSIENITSIKQARNRAPIEVPVNFWRDFCQTPTHC